MKYTFLLLISIFLVKSNDNKLYDFISKMNNEIDDYKEVGSVKEIPKEVFKAINKWKKQNFYAEKKMDSKIERKMFKFELAEKKEAINYGCVSEKKLLHRQLVFAAQNESEWLIIYNHSNGGAGIQTNMLHLNIEDADKLSLFRIHKRVENRVELMDHLQKMKFYNIDVLKNKIILIFGEPFSGDQNSMRKVLAV